MKRHIVPVGLPGAGKSTVAREAAAVLGTDFSEADDLIAERAGMDIPNIFSSLGEPHFRVLESEVMGDLLGRPPHVISPGGGWVCGVRNLGTVSRRALIIYLKTSPEVAAGRVGYAEYRPVLQGGGVEAMERLLALRETHYARAECTVTTDGRTASEVARDVVGVAREKAGW